jgi:hypothetical protein
LFFWVILGWIVLFRFWFWVASLIVVRLRLSLVDGDVIVGGSVVVVVDILEEPGGIDVWGDVDIGIVGITCGGEGPEVFEAL